LKQVEKGAMEIKEVAGLPATSPARILSGI